MPHKLTYVTAILIISVMSVSCRAPDTTTPPAYPSLEYSVTTEKDYTVEFIGTPYEIHVDNCENERDSTKTDERSKRYLAEVNLEISPKIATEFGGDVKLARFTLSQEIGVALGIKVGTQLEARSSVEIITPPGKRTVTTLQWKETWTKGEIAAIRPDGTYIDTLPFAALNSLTLEQLKSKTLDCPTGPVAGQETALPTSIPPTSAPPLPTDTPTAIPIPPTNTLSVNPAQATLVATCEWLKTNFPQSLEEVKVRFDLPDSTTNTFSLVTEICPGVANGFILRDAVTEFHLEVPPGGCIDSWSGETRYEGDVGSPVTDGFGGWRVYKGTVYTKGMTYRVANCELP